MALTKYKLGELIEYCDIRNSEGLFSEEDVRGISNTKELMPTKADLLNRSLDDFKVVYPNEFVFNRRTTRMGDKFAITLNNTGKAIILTNDYIVFKITRKDILLNEYLFILFNRPEFDRYVRFHSWGSATEMFVWESMCDIDIELPSLLIQQKYVDVYKAMLANQKSYERGLDDLKLTCDAYIENLRRETTCEKIGPYIRQCNEKNENNEVTLFQGVNVDHVFTDPKRVAEDVENGSIVRTGQFAFNKVMKAHNTKLPIAYREGPDCVVSNSYQVFEVSNKKKLLPKYLLLWMNRAETQRYAGFISFGTTRDIFSFEDMCEISIPFPDISTQQSIVDIFTAYQARTDINERLKTQLKDICPILIKGSLEEAKQEEAHG